MSLQFTERLLPRIQEGVQHDADRLDAQLAMIKGYKKV